MTKSIKLLFGIYIVMVNFVSASEIKPTPPESKTAAHKTYGFTLRRDGVGELNPDSETIKAGHTIYLHFHPYINIYFVGQEHVSFKVGDVERQISVPATYCLIYDIHITKDIKAKTLFDALDLL
jgi:hypothetical protein